MGDVDIVVKEDEICVHAGEYGTFFTGDTHDTGGRGCHHFYGVGQGDACEADHVPDESVGGGDAACKGASVGQFGDLVFDDDVYPVVEPSQDTGCCGGTGAPHGVGDERYLIGSFDLVYQL